MKKVKTPSPEPVASTSEVEITPPATEVSRAVETITPDPLATEVPQVAVTEAIPPSPIELAATEVTVDIIAPSSSIDPPATEVPIIQPSAPETSLWDALGEFQGTRESAKSVLELAIEALELELAADPTSEPAVVSDPLVEPPEPVTNDSLAGNSQPFDVSDPSEGCVFEFV